MPETYNILVTLLCNTECPLTLAIAGPKPFQRAARPSWATVFRRQSKKPEYVPEGADCSLDLSTCCNRSVSRDSTSTIERTSGGIAKDHIATPAVPPASMIAPRLSSDTDDSVGVNAFLVTSYAAK